MIYLFALVLVMPQALGAMELVLPEKSLVAKMVELAIVPSIEQNEPIFYFENLDFSECKIENLSSFIDSKYKTMNTQLLKQVESYPALYTIIHLNLSKNRLKDLPESLKELSHLEDFNGSENEFKSIPGVVRHWKNTLTNLDVSFNKVNSIERIGDEPLSNFKKLEWLNIKNNNIEALPCEELFELYQERKDNNAVIWVCVDREYELTYDLAKIKNAIFLKETFKAE